MATTTSANPNLTTTSSSSSSSTNLKLLTQQHPIKPKRRKFKETTITTISATSEHSRPDQEPQLELGPTSQPRIPPGSPKPTPFMDFSPVINNNNNSHHDSNCVLGINKFNSVLTAGLLSPPPQPRSSPTLSEMMASEPDLHPRGNSLAPGPNLGMRVNSAPVVVDKRAAAMQRIREMLEERVNDFNDEGSSDVRLNLQSKDGGVSVGVNVHREVLVGQSRFFAEKLGNGGGNSVNRRGTGRGGGAGYGVVEIGECEDVEVYVETVRLMYCEDVRRRLMRDDVGRVLDILKVNFFYVFVSLESSGS